jgi:cytochrome c-type biogenesis protein CcmH
MNDTIDSLRQQLLQLKSLHESGALDEGAYTNAKSGVERKLVDLVTSGASVAPAAPAAAESVSPRTAPPEPTAARAGTRLWIAAAAAVVVVAVAGYLWTGTPGAIGVKPGDATAGASGSDTAPHPLDQGQIAAMTEKLATRLKDKPDDADGWSMLGRSYMVLNKPDDAVSAYERAIKLRPDDATTLVDYADALAVKNGRNLDGEPTKLIARALKLEPDNLKALMLAGTVAFNGGDYKTAVKHWDRMAELGPADNGMVVEAGNGAAEARRLGNLPAAKAAAAAPVAKSDAAAGGGGAITGTITLAPALKALASPDDAVFIFARAPEGSRMPLAIVRKQVKDLPFEFRLDDSMAMSPAAKLSGAGRVVVGARVTKSGQAMPQPGDLEGLSAPVAVGASGLKVEIATAVK